MMMSLKLFLILSFVSLGVSSEVESPPKQVKRCNNCCQGPPGIPGAAGLPGLLIDYPISIHIFCQSVNQLCCLSVLLFYKEHATMRLRLPVTQGLTIKPLLVFTRKDIMFNEVL